MVIFVFASYISIDYYQLQKKVTIKKFIVILNIVQTLLTYIKDTATHALRNLNDFRFKSDYKFLSFTLDVKSRYMVIPK